MTKLTVLDTDVKVLATERQGYTESNFWHLRILIEVCGVTFLATESGRVFAAGNIHIEEAMDMETFMARYCR